MSVPMPWDTLPGPTPAQWAAALARWWQPRDVMRDRKSEDAQAARECASVARDDDPQPGALYGLRPPDTEQDRPDAEHQ